MWILPNTLYHFDQVIDLCDQSRIFWPTQYKKKLSLPGYSKTIY